MAQNKTKTRLIQLQIKYSYRFSRGIYAQHCPRTRLLQFKAALTGFDPVTYNFCNLIYVWQDISLLTGFFMRVFLHIRSATGQVYRYTAGF